MRRYQGMGLPEMMIGLFLASLIMLALMHHYIRIKQHYNVLQSALDVTSQVQWAVDLMRDSIHHAGFTPCLSVNRLISLDQRNGHEGLQAIDTHDALQINRMSSDVDEVIDWTNSSQLVATNVQTIRAEYPLLVADCYHAEVVTVRGLRFTSNKQFVTLNHPLAFTYQPPVYIGEWMEERFFIRSGRLFYHRYRTDELTPSIKGMSVSAKAALVNITLDLDDGRTLQVDTRIRSR